MNPMYNPNKFNYKELKRETLNGARKYITPDGFAVPSVTTILDATKPEEAKKALANWRKSIGTKKANEITKESSGRGTRLHKWLEDYINTSIIGDPGSNPYSQQSHLMAKTIIDNGLSKCNEFWATEASLYFPEMYAGTTDLVGVHENQEAIIDFKQTNKLKKREWIEDYFIQTVAYGTAHNEMFNTNIRKGVILMCSKDNQYQEFIIEGKEFDHYVNEWFKRLEQYYSKFV
jgi:genome maintenance exonuclease 1